MSKKETSDGSVLGQKYIDYSLPASKLHHLIWIVSLGSLIPLISYLRKFISPNIITTMHQ